MYMQIHIERERGKGTLSAAKKYLKKVVCVFAQEPYGLLQMLFVIFVRSVEDGLEPSQTYDEVNKLLLQPKGFLTRFSRCSKIFYCSHLNFEMFINKIKHTNISSNGRHSGTRDF